MGKRTEIIKRKWRGVKASKSFHNALVYLAFVVVATLFWVIMAMNDSVTRTFDVRLRIVNVPDSVTFINVPPQDIHVTLRDKGTNLLRVGIIKNPHIDINFRDFASDNVFRFSKADMNTALKTAFGNSAQIGSVSIDSLSLLYTADRGHRVPIVVRADVSAAAGNIIAGLPEPQERVVTIYALSGVADTISHVYTEPIVKRNLSETSEYTVSLVPIKGTRLEPSKVKVRIPVEPLVKKEMMATLKAENVPAGMNLLLFPNRVPVSFYVPMNLFNQEEVPFDVIVDYNDTRLPGTRRLPLRICSHEDYVVSPVVLTDSVEYTLVKE